MYGMIGYKAKIGGKMKDPICDMEVQDAKFKSTYKDKQYSFCSANCKAAFDKSPGKYVKG
jgi:YHS domain-containing protein